MTKKVGLVLVLAVFAATSAFAVDLSAGFGGNFVGHFDSLSWDGEVMGRSRTVGGGFMLFLTQLLWS
jgi:hypothetical protein